MRVTAVGATTPELHREVMRGGDAAGRVLDLMRARVQQRGELLEILHRHARIHGERHRRRRGEAERHEIPKDVERQLRIERRVERMGARHEEQRVAIGGRPRHRLGADVAARANAVLDNDLLVPELCPFVGDHAGGEIGRAAGRERHDEVHRLRRISALREAGAREKRE